VVLTLVLGNIHGKREKKRRRKNMTVGSLPENVKARFHLCAILSIILNILDALSGGFAPQLLHSHCFVK